MDDFPFLAAFLSTPRCTGQYIVGAQLDLNLMKWNKEMAMSGEVCISQSWTLYPMTHANTDSIILPIFGTIGINQEGESVYQEACMVFLAYSLEND